MADPARFLRVAREKRAELPCPVRSGANKPFIIHFCALAAMQASVGAWWET